MSIVNSASIAALDEIQMTEEEFQKLSFEGQLKYLNIMRAVNGFRKQFRAASYQPNPKQKAFHLSKAQTRAIFGGNRSGKTTAGGLEFIWHISGVYPDWYPMDMRLDHKKVKGRIVASDYMQTVAGVIVPFLEEWLNMDMVERKLRNPIGVYTKWFMKNGNQFEILTHEQDTKSFEGWKGDIAWFDEPPPRDKYISTTRGLIDGHGRAWLTLTPLNQPWIYDDIYKANDNRNTFVVTMSMRDNAVLSEDAIRQFELKLNDDEKLARMEGAFMHLTGRVYKQFKNEVHICEPFKIPAHWVRYMCVDPHPRKATAVVWLAVDDQENHYLYDELSFEGDAQQIAHMIHAQEGNLTAHQRFIDPAMDKDNQLFGGMNVRKELAKYGVYCQRANNDFDLGFNRICESLRPVYSQLLRKEVPRLRVFNTCTKTIYEFEHYMWSNYKRNPEEHGPKEKVKKVNDDFMDCLRYIYNAGPRFYDVMGKDEADSEVVYSGTYAKYATKQTDSGRGYYDLVERND